MNRLVSTGRLLLARTGLSSLSTAHFSVSQKRAPINRFLIKTGPRENSGIEQYPRCVSYLFDPVNPAIILSWSRWPLQLLQRLPHPVALIV